jgi:hypothetical protein
MEQVVSSLYSVSKSNYGFAIFFIQAVRPPTKDKRSTGTSVLEQGIYVQSVVPGYLVNRDAPDIRPDNPAFFDIRYPAGYQFELPDIR